MSVCTLVLYMTLVFVQYAGVLGLFNCQGGGWCPETRRNKSASEFSHVVTCYASPEDIEWCTGKTPMSIKGVDVFAVYFFKEKKLRLMKCSDRLEVSLEPFSFELMTMSPVKVFSKRLIQFAPIGLVNMLNSGGAVQSLEFDDNASLVKIGVRGCGEMRVFTSEKPVCCKIDGVSVEFNYEDKMVRVQILWSSSSTLSLVEFLF